MTDIKGADLDYSLVASYIPEVMNSLYNQDAFDSTSLTEMRDAFRIKQMQGKIWLLDALTRYCQDKTQPVLVIGSWFGFTSFCLWKAGFTNITEVDPDGRLTVFAKHLNRFNKQFKHITLDVNALNLKDYAIIINPSSEHIINNSWFDSIRSGSLVILHSTNMPAEDHTNLCVDVEEMQTKYPLDIRYSGTLDLEQYKRFMLIGYKF
jgi:hypothetical protein